MEHNTHTTAVPVRASEPVVGMWRGARKWRPRVPNHAILVPDYGPAQPITAPARRRSLVIDFRVAIPPVVVVLRPFLDFSFSTVTRTFASSSPSWIHWVTSSAPRAFHSFISTSQHRYRQRQQQQSQPTSITSINNPIPTTPTPQ